jgi:hypothetical protein
MAKVMTDGTGEPALATAGRPGDQQVLVMGEPMALGQFAQLCRREPAFLTVIELTDMGSQAKACCLDEPLMAAIEARGKLLFK